MWEERQIILYLKDYLERGDLDARARSLALKEGIERGDFFKYVSSRKKNKIGDGQITAENIDEWKDIRWILDECIEDGYVREELRHSNFIPKSYPPDEHYLFVTSKGKKLLRKLYYIEYLLNEFGSTRLIVLTFLATIITSKIWLPVWQFIVNLFNR